MCVVFRAVKWRMLIISAGLALFAALLVGCGGSSDGDTSASTSEEVESASEESPEDAVIVVVDEFSGAFGSGDVGTACALFSPKTISAAACESTYGGSPNEFSRSFSGAAVEGVEIDGQQAKVTLDSGDIVELEEVDGEWLVSNIGGASNTVPGSDAADRVADAGKLSARATAAAALLGGERAEAERLAEEGCPGEPVSKSLVEIGELAQESVNMSPAQLEAGLERLCPNE